MILDNKKALKRELSLHNYNKLDTSIISQSCLDFVFQDFAKSGISQSVINDYINNGYLTGNSESWSLFYPDLLTNTKTSYYTIRLKKLLLYQMVH